MSRENFKTIAKNLYLDLKIKYFRFKEIEYISISRAGMVQYIWFNLILETFD